VSLLKFGGLSANEVSVSRGLVHSPQNVQFFIQLHLFHTYVQVL
jgi:hypothetical protein